MPVSDHDSEFIDRIADTLYALPGVEAVALGGSRAQGADRPDSDWDVAVYYRSGFSPDSVRALGWPGHVTDLGGWGPLFNGGGWLTMDGRAVDLHYRDLTLIERIHADACHGDFTIEPLLFHQAGIPSYILLAELGINRPLRGDLPVWEYPPALRTSAPPIWWGGAELTLGYAEAGHARHGRVAQCIGLLSEAACRTAHAILAHRAEWVTNEKRMLDAAGLRAVDRLVSGLGPDSDALVRAARDVRELLTNAIRAEGITTE